MHVKEYKNELTNKDSRVKNLRKASVLHWQLKHHSQFEARVIMYCRSIASQHSQAAGGGQPATSGRDPIKVANRPPSSDTSRSSGDGWQRPCPIHQGLDINGVKRVPDPWPAILRCLFASAA